MGKTANPRRVAENEALAVARRIRVGAQKLNLVAQSIRGLDVNGALATLTFSKRRVSNDVKKVLQSAIANAENNHQLDVDRLYVAEASVGRSMVLRRFRARARGRGASIQKPFSRLRIVVRERAEAE
ncbi:MAG: 50S ribosomal protein L22 [Alphaproteobacteria bacterium]|jgi:large subunit ribosomal protein L22|nr:50S ribosomal protein L22 [Alphaproteobacteria bacterium]